jgi:hypothetical protein
MRLQNAKAIAALTIYTNGEADQMVAEADSFTFDLSSPKSITKGEVKFLRVIPPDVIFKCYDCITEMRSAITTTADTIMAACSAYLKSLNPFIQIMGQDVKDRSLYFENSLAVEIQNAKNYRSKIVMAQKGMRKVKDALLGSRAGKTTKPTRELVKFTEIIKKFEKIESKGDGSELIFRAKVEKKAKTKPALEKTEKVAVDILNFIPAKTDEADDDEANF